MAKEKEYSENNVDSQKDQPANQVPSKEGEAGEQLDISPENGAEANEEIDERTASFEAIVAELEHSLATINDKYLRLSAEFDNYRKRTLREKMELTRTAGESVMQSMLPLIDDFERAMNAMEQGLDIEATREGINLIYSKFKEFTNQKGVREIEALGQVFNTDLHEAVTKIPAPSEDLKGKILDVIQKGYCLNDKVIRFAKVVVGE